MLNISTNGAKSASVHAALNCAIVHEIHTIDDWSPLFVLLQVPLHDGAHTIAAVIHQTVPVKVGLFIGAFNARFVIVANNPVAQSYTDFTDGNFVLLAWSVERVVDLFAAFSGT